MRLRSWLVLLLALCAIATRADALKIRIRDVGPTQMEIGRATVNEYVESWKKKADKAEMSLGEYAQKVVVKKLNRLQLPVIIDPSGKVRNTDGHHRIAALLDLQRMTGVDLSIKTHVTKDYRGWDQEDYAKDFLDKRGKGRFTDEVAALPATERIRYLPTTYARMRNSAMRAAVGRLFDRLHIKDATFADYIEFEVGDRLVKSEFLEELADSGIVSRHGMHRLPPRLAFDERVQRRLALRLTSPVIRNLLLRNAADEEARRKVERMLDKLEARLR